MSHCHPIPRIRQCRLPLIVMLVTAGVVMQSLFGTTRADEPSKSKANSAAVVKPDWRPLEGSWETIRFGGEGDVKITKDLITLESGEPMTGVRWTGKVLKDNYEIELQGRRTSGFDFFCGLTFPIGDENASLILGGWGGGVVGLSSINGADASENETTQYLPFENNQWYKIRVRVTAEKIECFVDGKSIVDVEREDRLFDTRFEMETSKPLGIAAYQCGSEFRDLKVRKLGQADSEASGSPATDSKKPAASNAESAK